MEDVLRTIQKNIAEHPELFKRAWDKWKEKIEERELHKGILYAIERQMEGEDELHTMS